MILQILLIFMLPRRTFGGHINLPLSVRSSVRILIYGLSGYLLQFWSYSFNILYDVYAHNGGWLVYNFLWSGGGHARVRWAIVTTERPSSVVRPSVNFSHFNQLLWKHWANLNQTLVEWSLDGPLPKLCPAIPTSNQDGRQAKNRKKGGWNFNCSLLLSISQNELKF